MREVLLLKGKHEILNLPKNSEKADKLYSFLIKLFESKGFKINAISSIPDYKVADKLSKDTIYLIGHSRGANKILKELNSEYPKLRGIILFDPLDGFADSWNNLMIKKILFASAWGQNYSEFNGAINLKDDHYFNNSFKKIKEEIENFLD